MASFYTINTYPQAPVASGDTLTFAYPSGAHRLHFYGKTGNKLVANGAVYTEAASDFTIAFGASEITVTWAHDTPIAAGQKVVLEAQARDLATEETWQSPVAPAHNADKIGRRCVDTVTSSLYAAHTTGSGASDWTLIGDNSLSLAELAFLDGASSANSTASKAVILDSSGNLAMPGTSTFTGAVAVNAAFVFNESGADLDARFEGDADANLIFLDASADKVGVGTATPSGKLDVVGNLDIYGDASVARALRFAPHDVPATRRRLIGVGAGNNNITIGDTDVGSIAFNADGTTRLTLSTSLLTSTLPVRVPSYTVGTVPAANAGAGQIIYISDEMGGATVAFSDGTNWKRVSDLATAS